MRGLDSYLQPPDPGPELFEERTCSAGVEIKASKIFDENGSEYAWKKPIVIESECTFEGPVDVWVDRSSCEHWTCPECGTEHEEAAQEYEPEPPERDWDD